MPSTIPFKTVDPAIADHPVERRGFVPVPLDYDDPSAGEIAIFYRLIPTYGGSPDDADKPIVVVFNGGPGIPASFYRPLDFDYETHATPLGGLDRFKHLLKTHRVLLADQRGTDGGSAPLDLDDPSIDANEVARLFSSDAHARDYAAVIDAVVPEGQPFFIIAQSYGGMPGMQYLGLPAARRPAGVVFASSALPYEDVLATNLDRRREQLRLNLALRDAFPDVEARLARTRAHLAAEGVDPGKLNGLFTLLGKDVPGVWEPALVARLDALCAQDGDAIRADMTARREDPDLLNYILSSVNFTAGFTDRTLALHAREHVPFEPWMIDETWILLETGQDGTWREQLIADLDAAPPPPTPFPSVDTLRAAIADHEVLFTAADNDAFVPPDSYRASLAKFFVDGRSEVATLPGGHHAIFLERGYEVFLAWSTDPRRAPR